MLYFMAGFGFVAVAGWFAAEARLKDALQGAITLHEWASQTETQLKDLKITYHAYVQATARTRSELAAVYRVLNAPVDELQDRPGDDADTRVTRVRLGLRRLQNKLDKLVAEKIEKGEG